MVEFHSSNSWKPLLTFFSRDCSINSLVVADEWLNEMTSSAYGTRPLVWAELTQDLSHCSPLLINESLIFSPVFFHLPTYVQNHLLMFIYRHREEIPLVPLMEFVDSLMCKSQQMSNWINLTFSLLNHHCLCAKLYVDSNYSHPVTQFKNISEASSHSHESTGPFKVCGNLLHTSVNPFSFTESNLSAISGLSELLKSEAQLASMTAADITSKWCVPCPLVFEPAAAECGQSSSLHSSQFMELSDEFFNELSKSVPGVVNGVRQVSVMNTSASIDDSLHSSPVPQALLVTFEQFKDQWLQGLAVKDLSLLNSLNSGQFKSLCEVMNLHSLSDVGIGAACQSFVNASDELSISCVAMFAELYLLPRIVDLEQPASRMLASALVMFSLAFSRQIAETVLLTIVCRRHCSTFTAELLTKLIREVYIAEKKVDLLSCLLTVSSVWSEPVLSALQLVLDSKIELADIAVHRLVGSLCLNAAESVHLASPKFGKILLSSVNLYGSRLSGSDLLLLQRCADDHKSFMKKPVQLALLKLRT